MLKPYKSFFKESVVALNFKVQKIGRKWIQGVSEFKGNDLLWYIEITPESKTWEIGKTYNINVEAKVERSSYETKRYGFLVGGETLKNRQEEEKREKALKEIKRWMSYIEDNLKNYWYKKGEDVVNSYLKYPLTSEEINIFKSKLEDLKNKHKELKYPQELERWLSYIKDNMEKYWYGKGEENVIKYATMLGVKKEYEEILNDLKQEYKQIQINNKAEKEIKKYKSSDVINISWSPDSYFEGKVLYRKELDKWITILKIVSKWYGDDAMSFGGNSEGYVVSAYYRDATPQEEKKEKEIQNKKAEYRKKKDKIEKYFSSKKANIPKKVNQNDVGDLYHFKGNGHNIYGGGLAFGITSKNLWEIRNNGMDGDMWDNNNFSTGGAGAIAKKYPYNEEIADLIREICLQGLTERIKKYKS